MWNMLEVVNSIPIQHDKMYLLLTENMEEFTLWISNLIFIVQTIVQFKILVKIRIIQSKVPTLYTSAITL